MIGTYKIDFLESFLNMMVASQLLKDQVNSEKQDRKRQGKNRISLLKGKTVTEDIVEKNDCRMSQGGVGKIMD